MVSTAQEFIGLNKALDRLEVRIKQYRKIQRKMMDGQDPGDWEQARITVGEVEIIETLVRRMAEKVLGSNAQEIEWESLHTYCSRHQGNEEDFSRRNYESLRWALIWIEKTRTYIEYLSGMQSVGNEHKNIENTTYANELASQSPRYDVALSFAGEDRHHARKIADLLLGKDFSVFYDEYEQATLWGRNLYTHLSDIYQNKARYCLMFISSYYAKKLWTKRERESAQARAFKESKEYILPIRLDDTVLPGIEDTIGYVDLRNISYEDVVQLLCDKFRKQGESQNG